MYKYKLDSYTWLYCARNLDKKVHNYNLIRIKMDKFEKA